MESIPVEEEIILRAVFFSFYLWIFGQVNEEE